MVFSRRRFKNIHRISNGLALNIDAHFTFFDNHFRREREMQKFPDSLLEPGASPVKTWIIIGPLCAFRRWSSLKRQHPFLVSFFSASFCGKVAIGKD